MVAVQSSIFFIPSFSDKNTDLPFARSGFPSRDSITPQVRSLHNFRVLARISNERELTLYSIITPFDAFEISCI